MDMRHSILSRIISIIVLFSYCGMIIRPCVATKHWGSDPFYETTLPNEHISFRSQTEKPSSFQPLEVDPTE
ncbi:MAG: hypothetical protein K2Q34_00205, partial [Alphaproteobacteria bacterium]|nr:hypothetical protein [Alphaproteobacteria bacterium]